MKHKGAGGLMQYVRKKIMPCAVLLIAAFGPAAHAGQSGMASLNNEAGGLFIPISRSELVVVNQDIAEIVVADPDISDVHVIGSQRVIFIGKKIGRTNAKLFDKNNHVIRQFDIIVGYDLPAIRKALHVFLPQERIGVELVNTNIALVGEVSDASAVDKALKVVNQFVTATGTSSAPVVSTPGAAAGAAAGGGGAAPLPGPVLNLLKVISGQQVLLHVRVGEIQRTTVKNLGIDFAMQRLGGGATILGASNGGINRFVAPASSTSSGTTTTSTPASVGLTTINTNDNGLLGGFFNLGGGVSLSAVLEALESDGLFKVLAEPDLVAISGEKAEFLAGGEFPILTPQIGGGTAVTTVQFKDFGVAVQFVPFVLSDNRIRIVVQPEVSEINNQLTVTSSGSSIPALNTRRVKTTVELAPGESFMIAGLLQDNLSSNIGQVPGASDVPILGALFRNTSFNRTETELVIAVTPYIVDPLKSGDVRFPSDDFRPATTMEQFLFGTLGAMSGNSYHLSQTPSLEGPIGFMTD